ncbi:hypothetical protein MMC34_000563 [Xylographa carneopallida]|nr:hypothetical protein [Xylographa carneopallida]
MVNCGAPDDGSDNPNLPDLDYLNNPNLFEMDLDEAYRQFTGQSIQDALGIGLGSEEQPFGPTLTEDFSDPMDTSGGLDSSMAESYNPAQSSDPLSNPYTSPTNPYSQSAQTRTTPQISVAGLQGNTRRVGDQQSQNRSSTEYVWNPQNWTDLVKTKPYPAGLDSNSLAHRHLGIKSYLIPNHIDPTFLYHGQRYTKAGEDDDAEDLALSDVDEQKYHSAQQRRNIGRVPNTQGLPIPYPTKLFNTQASQSLSQPTEYLRANPCRPAGTNTSGHASHPRAQTQGPAAMNPNNPGIQPWDVPSQQGIHQTGIYPTNPYSSNPSQNNPYQDIPYPTLSNQDSPFQLDNDIADNLDPDIFPHLTMPQDISRTTTSTPITNITRPASRIPLPVRRDSTRPDPRRRDSTRADPRRRRAQTVSQIGSNTRPNKKRDLRGRAEPINRVGSNTNLNKNNRRADSRLLPGTYEPLPAPPSTWTSTNGKQFVYDISGELQNGTYYTVREIEDFLYQNPRRANMMLWVQRLPADSAARYPYSESRRCRFLNCVMSNGTINQGHHRIAFDELSSTHERHDPMHNAGYVHLYCFEKFLDFPKIIYDLNVQAEQRDLPLEPKKRSGWMCENKNRMMVSTHGELNVATEFIEYCQEHGRGPLGYPHFSMRNENPPAGKLGHENTLVHRLWQMKIRHDSGTITAAKKRGAKASTGVGHMGNLEIENYERGETRKKENQTIRTPDPKSSGRPRSDSETTARDERAQRRRKLLDERTQLATSLRDLESEDSEDDDEYDDKADEAAENDSLFVD